MDIHDQALWYFWHPEGFYLLFHKTRLYALTEERAWLDAHKDLLFMLLDQGRSPKDVGKHYGLTVRKVLRIYEEFIRQVGHARVVQICHVRLMREMSLASLPIPKRTKDILRTYGCDSLHHLLALTTKDFLACRGPKGTLGRGSLKTVQDVLSRYRLSLREE